MSPLSLRQLHNVFGEDDDVLTILSLLPHKPVASGDGGDRADAEELSWERPVEMSLHDVEAWLYRIVGEDGKIRRDVSIARAGGQPEFHSFEDSPVQEVVRRLYEVAGNDDMATLTIVTSEDEPSGESPDDESPDDGTLLGEVFRRFIDAARGLFNIAGDDGEPLTVLSILVHHPVHTQSRSEGA